MKPVWARIAAAACLGIRGVQAQPYKLDPTWPRGMVGLTTSAVSAGAPPPRAVGVHLWQNLLVPVWIADIGDATVKQFDLAGALISKIGRDLGRAELSPPQFSSIADVALTPWGDVVAVDGDDSFNNRMLSLRGAGEAWTVTYDVGGNGSAPGKFNSPHSVAYAASSDTLIVVDRYNKRLQGLAGRV